MTQLRICARGLILLLVIALAGSADAKMRMVSMFELAEQSDVVFVGEVTRVEDAATVGVVRVLSGRLYSDSVSVTPIYLEGCVGRSINFSMGEKVLIFGQSTGGKSVTVLASGQGKWHLDPVNEEVQIGAAMRISEITRLKDEDSKNRAMLAEAKSQNPMLRSESRSYISLRFAKSTFRQNCKDVLASLINDSAPEIQLTGLQGIQYVQAPDSIPRMIELTRSQDLSIVSAASEALAQYRTRESVAALIALTRHPDPSIRIRACFDVRGSGRPEADEAEERLLDDKEPNVRAMVIGSFCGRIELDKFIPRFAEMLNDPDAQVRSSAAYALGRCGDSPVAASHVAKVLLAALKKEPHGSNLERALLEALYQKSGRSEAIGLIDNNIDLLIAALKRGGPNDWFGSSSCYALEILSRSNNPEAKAALTWAAWSHPNAFIRGEGRRYLPWTPVKIAFVRLICMLIVTLVVSLVLAVILRAVAKSVQNLDVGLRSAYVTVFLPAVAIVTIGLFVSLAVGAVTHPKWASNVVWSLVFAIAFLGQSYSIRSRLRISLTRACLFSLVPFAMACLVVAIAFFATAKTFT